MFEALRRSEQRYRRIVTTTQEGVWTVDAAQRTTFVNQRMAEIVGYSPAELLGRPLLDFVAPEERALLASKFAERRGGVHDRYEHRSPARTARAWWSRRRRARCSTTRAASSGRWRWSATSPSCASSRPACCTGRSSRASSVLAGGVAHDFNNLLAGVLGNVGVARAELPADAPVQALLQDAEEAASRAAELTAQMLAYAGKGRFVVQRLSLSRVIDEQSQLLHAVISKKARLETDFAADLPDIEGDAPQLVRW
jgi:two-component system cell cycle sensor histidine kinase/response regulator CckA